MKIYMQGGVWEENPIAFNRLRTKDLQNEIHFVARTTEMDLGHW